MHNDDDGRECPRRLASPLTGWWSLPNYPELVELTIDGEPRCFARATIALDRYDAVAQYREDVPRDALHLYVLRDGTWIVDHADCANPTFGLGLAAEHLDRDVGLGGFATAALVVVSMVTFGAAVGGLASLFFGGGGSRRS